MKYYVIFQAGASPKGQAYAAKYADAVFTLGESFTQAKYNYDAIKQQAEAFGRDTSAYFAAYA